MGALVAYFQRLSRGEVIDGDIIEVMRNPRMQNFCNDIRVPPINKWKYSHIGSRKFNYVYIPWVEGNICYGKIENGRDFISKPFSGCYMAAFEENGTRYGAHIHKGNLGDMKDEWNRLVTSNNLTVYGLFKPEIANMNGGNEVWGMISDNNKCFSILVNTFNQPLIQFCEMTAGIRTLISRIT